MASHITYNSKNMIVTWLLFFGKKKKAIATRSIAWMIWKVYVSHTAPLEQKEMPLSNRQRYVISFCNSDYIWVLHHGCNEAGI